MAAKAPAANSLGLSWPPPLKKRRVGRPSRRDLYVDAVYKHIDEHAPMPADFTLACRFGGSEFLDTDMHPPTPIGDEAVDVFEPNEEDIMDTGILDVADDTTSASAEATPAPTAAESDVEVADVEGAKLSKLETLRIV